MRTKSEVFSWFREFKALVENQIGKKTRVSRSNNGGQYTSNEFNNLCREAGIKRELTVHLTNHSNSMLQKGRIDPSLELLRR
jgi:hypothetical protein